MRTARALALILGLLPLACARTTPPPAPVAVTAPTTAESPAPAWPDAARGPQAPGLDETVAVPSEPTRETFAAREELPDVHFASGEIRVERGDIKTLDAVAAWLRANPDQLVLVEGHTDAVGPRAANLQLAQRRARWVMDYLIARGVAAERITAVTRGENDTLCAEKSTACQRRNRRVHFLVRESGTLQLSASPTP